MLNRDAASVQGVPKKHHNLQAVQTHAATCGWILVPSRHAVAPTRLHVGQETHVSLVLTWLSNDLQGGYGRPERESAPLFSRAMDPDCSMRPGNNQPRAFGAS
jgi:hypothetical protein